MALMWLSSVIQNNLIKRKFMRFLRRFLASFSLGLVALSAGASPSAPVNGVDYLTLPKAQQTESGKKVEVTEFFWYGCPHCNAFEPALEDWVKKQGDAIVFKRVPIAFRDTFVPQQKLYYALEGLGKVDELQKKIFQAIHIDRQPLEKEAAFTDFVVKQGVDRQKFLEMYNSFAVQTKARRATQMQEAYKIDGVPTIAIDGRFLTSPSIVGTGLGPNQPETALQAAALKVMDVLVARVSKERGSDSKPAAKAVEKAAKK
jgi:protein dithiol oxidoreductase (disulfide-forming)